MSRRCIFCNSVPVTREHILGRWLRPMVPGTGAFTHSRSGASGAPHIVWSSDSIDYKVKLVCEACNNGWMRALDEATSPIIGPLVQGQRTALSTEAKSTLASWLSKVQLLFQYMANPPRPASQARRAAMSASHGPFKGTYVSLGTYEGRWPLWARYHELQLIRPSKPLEPLAGERLTISIGKFAAQIFLGPEHSTHAVALTPVDATRDWLQPLWPDVTPIIWPPLRAMSDADLETFSTWST